MKQNCGSLSQKESLALVRRRQNLLQKYFLILKAGETKKKLEMDASLNHSNIQ